MGIQSREVKQRHAVYHEAGQMLGRQTVAQPHRQIERLLVVHGFEGSTHAQQYTISDAGAASLRQTASVTRSTMASNTSAALLEHFGRIPSRSARRSFLDASARFGIRGVSLGKSVSVVLC